MNDGTLSPNLAAPQRGPRPLPLFLKLLRGETAAFSDRRAAALAGLARYQAAPRGALRAEQPVVASRTRATLRDFGGAGTPVVFVPSLINPPFVLDLAPQNSLLRWLAGRGHRVLLVDWGTPDPGDRAQDVTAHIEDLLLPMLHALGEPPILVGYCLGGTMALGAAAAIAPAGVALIATPWHFAGFGDVARADIAALWSAARPLCDGMGLVPVEVLQTGFWHLDPARTIAKFEALATADDAALAEFVALEDWANSGAPLTLGAGRQLFEHFFAADDPGAGRWTVAGHIVDPRALDCPSIDFISTRDRIVPAASAAGLADRRDVDAGHVGMVVGRRARALLWEPLADWLSGLAAVR